MKVIVESKVRGKARPRFNTETGRAFTTKETVCYENLVKRCYIEQSGKYLDGAIGMDIDVYFKVPKSYTKKRLEKIRCGLERPTKKPDIDNIIKIIADSLNKIAYNDDAQIVEMVVRKHWTEDAERVEFTLKEI